MITQHFRAECYLISVWQRKCSINDFCMCSEIYIRNCKYYTSFNNIRVGIFSYYFQLGFEIKTFFFPLRDDCRYNRYLFMVYLLCIYTQHSGEMFTDQLVRQTGFELSVYLCQNKLNNFSADRKIEVLKNKF